MQRITSPTPPAQPAQPRPNLEQEIPAAFKAGSLIMLSGLLLAVGGIVLGIALGGAWVLPTGGLGLAAGVVLGMLGLFGALSHGSSTRVRLNGTTLLGWLVALGGLGLGWYLGRRLGVGAGLLLLGVGSFVTGLGIAFGSSVAQPRPAPPVMK